MVISLIAMASPPAIDARLLPRALPKKAASGITNTKGVVVSVKFRSDRRAILLSFTKLSVAKAISYTLTYDSAGVTQGAGGSVDPGSPEPASRELVFGTSSNGVYRYHTGIKNAKLVITTTLKTGKKVVKSFKLKM